ncbi:IS30 family transposase [Williamsoniiplasma lucivorax]|uniref:Transposase n=2 Tax=Williamsoniiplasma lucivorax TaxID=209274 RepID=A0A2S5R9V3_9MOLU|nr:IS30 family transposase [Williamsoniiplasma lucivorax]PPE04077.1 transposase [Williamsoniiplasma lucivorax]
MKNYKQLSFKERTIIEYLHKLNKSITYIAKELGRNKSTISRELKKNLATPLYIANDAQFTTGVNMQKLHLAKMDKFPDFLNFLYANFEPKFNGIDVCVFKAKQLGIKTPTTQTVYNWIHSKAIKIEPKHLLRPRYWFKKTNKYKRYLYELSKMEVIPITYRPKHINDRSEFGHYEIDLVVGAGKSKSILTLVERMTRMAFAIKLENKTMKYTNEKLRELIKKESIKIKSITKDNGLEFNLLHEVTKEINASLYACNTYASCEKGSNENFNGLLRRALPKKTSFEKLENDNINSILDQINKMPRKLLNYNSAQQLYEAFC